MLGIPNFIRERRYLELKAHLETAPLKDLLGPWKGFKPLEKLILFKLLSADRALRLYDSLDASEKYFMFCGLNRETIAPIVENLSDRERGLFVEIPKNSRYRMSRELFNSPRNECRL